MKRLALIAGLLMATTATADQSELLKEPCSNFLTAYESKSQASEVTAIRFFFMGAIAGYARSLPEEHRPEFAIDVAAQCRLLPRLEFGQALWFVAEKRTQN